MKTKKNTTSKFSLEKFEIARLKNLREIKGGYGEENKPNTGVDLPTITDTSKNCNNGGTVNL